MARADGGIEAQFPDAAAAGVLCGDVVCSRGQTCCIDCDGHASCGDPGAICEGKACTSQVDATPKPTNDSSVVQVSNFGDGCRAAGGHCGCSCNKGFDEIYIGTVNDCPQPCDTCGACSLACCVPLDPDKVGDKCRAAGGSCSCSCQDGSEVLSTGPNADCPTAPPGSFSCDDVCCLPTAK